MLFGLYDLIGPIRFWVIVVSLFYLIIYGLSRELADLQLKVQTGEEKLVRYQKDHGILGVDEKQNVVTEKLTELNKELTEAETDRIEKEADYRLASNGDPDSFTKITPEGRNTGRLLDKLHEKEADLETQYAMTTTEFGSGYPKVTELSNQLKQVRSSTTCSTTASRCTAARSTTGPRAPGSPRSSG